MTGAAAHYIVVGSGNIAKRHISNLKLLDPSGTIACLTASGRPMLATETRADTVSVSIQEAVASRPRLAIIASPAPFHLAHAEPFARAGIPLLIEKPVSDHGACDPAWENVLRNNADRILVGYNLRFLEAAQKLHAMLQTGHLGRLHTVLIDCGQYLPDWRPGSDYRQGVSARAELGGGVLLELSHELDYLTWLFGRPDSVYCTATNSGTLGIDVEDTVDALFDMGPGRPKVALHMDFLQRAAHRTCKVIGAHATAVWDVRRNQLRVETGSGAAEILHDDAGLDRNTMYLDELRHALEVADGRARPLVTLDDGLYVLTVIAAMRRSARTETSVRIGKL
jgi:predicted dehydrogenase